MCKGKHANFRLQGRAELNGEMRETLRWVSERKRYSVRLDNNGELIAVNLVNLRSELVEVVEDAEDDMVTVNNLHYCSAHRSEVCGACGYNLILRV